MTIIRGVAIGLGAVEAAAAIAVFCLLLAGGSQSADPLGRAIGQGMARLLAIPFILCVLPGLILALANRHVHWALALTIIALPATAMIWRSA